MGFECGISIVLKKDGLNPWDGYYTNTLYQYLVTESNICFNSSTLKDYYTSFKEYFEKTYNTFSKTVKLNFIPTQEDIDFYTTNKEENINFWCSSGRYIDDYMLQNLNQIKPFEAYKIYPNFINNALIWVLKELDEMQMKSVSAIKGTFINNSNEEVIYPIKNLLVEDEDGNQKLIDLEYDNIYIPIKYYDEDKYNTLKDFKDTLLKLKDVDFSKYHVYYYRSY